MSPGTRKVHRATCQRSARNFFAPFYVSAIKGISHLGCPPGFREGIVASLARLCIDREPESRKPASIRSSRIRAEFNCSLDNRDARKDRAIGALIVRGACPSTVGNRSTGSPRESAATKYKEENRKVVDALTKHETRATRSVNVGSRGSTLSLTMLQNRRDRCKGDTLTKVGCTKGVVKQHIPLARRRRSNTWRQEEEGKKGGTGYWRSWRLDFSQRICRGRRELQIARCVNWPCQGRQPDYTLIVPTWILTFIQELNSFLEVCFLGPTIRP